MAAIANQNGRHMVQHVLPCKYPFPLKFFIFKFITIYFDFILAAILKITKKRGFKQILDSYHQTS
jgi:ABC-type maltose transport system permease subunit